MPTYDYVCDACDHKFELFQSFTENPKKKCPACGKSKLRRLFGTGAALMFKGSGFHTTDYRSDSYTKAASAEKSSGDGKGSSDSKGSGDSKSASDNKAAAKSDSTKSKKTTAKD
jgi:putative FmdB family regulatory protein